jgi:hypothetical protein
MMSYKEQMKGCEKQKKRCEDEMKEFKNKWMDMISKKGIQQTKERMRIVEEGIGCGNEWIREESEGIWRVNEGHDE